MTDGIEIKVEGIKEVNKALYSYSQQLGDRVVLKALREGAKLVQKDARKRVPRRTGTLRRGITIKNSKIHSKRRSNGKLGVYLTLKSSAFYGRFLEDGTKYIQARRFIKGAFDSKKHAAVSLTVKSAERGAEIIKRKVGLR